MKKLAPILLSWYEKNKRNLPWRNITDPYLIWISEIILQQTRVSQGYDYFVRFVRRFPDLSSLTSASEDEVLKYWEGLGYYSRARNLHAAAKSMNGVFPSTYEGVRALKGVGDYTAAAICSFAYKMPYAVVDGNVYRVLSRIFGIETPVDSFAGKKEISVLAQKLLDTRRPDDYNQAIMDFGALQCIPSGPDCGVCPFAKLCVAYRLGQVDSLPVRTGKTKISERYFSYIYVKQGADTWLHRRGDKDIWRGLYEFPLLESEREISSQTLKQTVWWRGYFGGFSPRLSAGPLKHILSHRVIHAFCYMVEIPPDWPVPDCFFRISQQKVADYALPRLLHKLIQLPQTGEK